MAGRAKKKPWLWLLLLPPLLGVLWLRGEKTESAAEPALGSSPEEIGPAAHDKASAAEEQPPPPPRFAVAKGPPLPPLLAQPTPTAPAQAKDAGLPKAGPAQGEPTDDAIAAFDAGTIAMLNSHKYWTPQGLVDRLYDAWLNKKVQGLDVEDVRKQIGWALKGMFMEEY